MRKERKRFVGSEAWLA